MAENYYADFYVTCATVIPVFLLVVAVQARTYEGALESLPKHQRGLRVPLLVIAYAIVLFGGVGEFGALWELRRKQDTVGWNKVVFLATLLLLAVVLYVPLLGNLRAAFGQLRLTPEQRDQRLKELQKIRGLVRSISEQATLPVTQQEELADALSGINLRMPECGKIAAAKTAQEAQEAAAKAKQEVQDKITSLPKI
jgi:hypothetical protein